MPEPLPPAAAMPSADGSAPVARERPDRGRAAPAAPLARLLVVDPDPATLPLLANACAELATVRMASFPEVAAGDADVVLVDPATADPHQVLAALRPPGRTANSEVVFIGKPTNLEQVVAALHRGAADWVEKPLVAARVRHAVLRALERRRLLEENEQLKRDLALFGAAQRILETLDHQRLMSLGMDALVAFSGAQAAVIFDERVADTSGVAPAMPPAVRGLAPDEELELVAPSLAVGVSLQTTGAAVGVPRFAHAHIIGLGEGRAAAVFSTALPPRDVEGAVLFVARQLQTAFRTTERFAHASEQALRDPLTGLWNALALDTAARRLLDESKKTGHPFSLLFLDLDHFKQVNDHHGHAVGSRVIVEVGAVLRQAVREGDVVSRFGGDEFTILLPGIDAKAAWRVAERIRETVSRTAFADVPGLHVTTCIGLASWPGDGASAEALFEAADRAMYLGKAHNRNQTHQASDVLPASTFRG